MMLLRLLGNFGKWVGHFGGWLALTIFLSVGLCFEIVFSQAPDIRADCGALQFDNLLFVLGNEVH